MPVISKIYYYPVKGLRGISLESTPIEVAERLPFDRCYAIGDARTEFEAATPKHVRKQNLVVQMSHEKLAELQLKFTRSTHRLELQHESQPVLDAQLNTIDGCTKTETFLTHFLGDKIRPPARLISAPNLAFTDLPDKSLSIINLNSVRAIEEKLGYPVDHRRFRANLYIDDVPAWSEESWIGRQLVVGDVILKAYRITDRCAAINVHPDEAYRDKTLQELKRHFGHLNMGVYASVERAGSIKRGQNFEVELS